MQAYLAAVANYLKRYWIVNAIMLIIVVTVIMWVAGYRISNHNIVRVGELEIIHLSSAAIIFIDQAPYNAKGADSLDAQLVPGSHTIIVSVEGAQPWETIATVETRKTTIVDPIYFPQRPNVQPLAQKDLTAAYRALYSVQIPSVQKPLTVGCTAVSVAHNQVIATATSSTDCLPPEFLSNSTTSEATIVFTPKKNITNVLPYPGRTDALLVSVDDSLYALGLDPRTPQAFTQLLSSPYLRVSTLPDGTLIAQNATGIYRISL